MISVSASRGASRIHDFVLAGLIYLPTLFFVPAAGYVLSILFFILFSKAQPLQKRDWLLILFSGLALINVAIGMPWYIQAKHGFMLSVLFIFPCMWIGRSLNVRILKFFLAFTILECLTILYEVINHKVFIFAAQGKNVEDLADSGSASNLLYYFRPFGLSANSSTMALKIFMGILLVFFLFDQLKYPKLWLMTLYLFCILTFNRTAMVTTLLISCVLYVGHILTIRKLGRRILPHIILWLIAIILINHFLGDAIFQFTRGGNSNSGVLTGRTQIWASAISFIVDHPLLGNHSMAFRVLYDNKQMHCHNSFLQIIATHGVIALFLLAYIVTGLRFQNLIFIIPMLIFSLTQYGVFWNFSYMDVLFYFFLDWRGSVLSRRLIDYKKATGRRIVRAVGD